MTNHLMFQGVPYYWPYTISSSRNWHTLAHRSISAVDDGQFRNKIPIAAINRAELAQGLKDLAFGIDKTHQKGRFVNARITRDMIQASCTPVGETVPITTNRTLVIDRNRTGTTLHRQATTPERRHRPSGSFAHLSG